MSYRRHTYDSKTLPDNANQLIEQCRQRVQQTIRENRLNQVINMNQTFVLYDSMPLYTYHEKGASRVDVRSSRGNKKLGCTVALTITADGRKAPAEIIFRNQAADVVEELRRRAPENVRVGVIFVRCFITQPNLTCSHGVSRSLIAISKFQKN